MGKQLTNMEPGFRRVGGASCKIEETDFLPSGMRSRTRAVTSVYTEPEKRGKGYGTTLMHSICREADKMNIILVLEAMPYGQLGLRQDELELWYQVRFGFQMIQLEPRLFARMPGATPKVGLRLTNTTKAVLEAVK